MNCPSPIATILVELLRTGLLRIRAIAAAGNSERCAIEADHLHNLPTLLVNYDPELLRFYWEVERKTFMDQSSTVSLAHFERTWEELRKLLTRENLLDVKPQPHAARG
jgi:hypothetical protein